MLRPRLLEVEGYSAAFRSPAGASASPAGARARQGAFGYPHRWTALQHVLPIAAAAQPIAGALHFAQPIQPVADSAA